MNVGYQSFLSAVGQVTHEGGSSSPFTWNRSRVNAPASSEALASDQAAIFGTMYVLKCLGVSVATEQVAPFDFRSGSKWNISCALTSGDRFSVKGGASM